MQLELFNQAASLSPRESSGHNNKLLAYIWSYEKTILLVIGIIITAVISFSLGVEKGRKIVSASKPQPLTSPVHVPQPRLNIEQRTVTAVATQLQKPRSPVVQGYTIQLASYRFRSYAQREADVLKRRGIDPLILVKGSYTVLCVGNFANREIAKTMLAELRRRYPSCYIRRI